MLFENLIQQGGEKVTYIDRLNQFHRQIVYYNLPPHAGLLYFHLLNIANQLGWQENFSITARRLELLTGLSKWKIQDAKRELKNLGLIDFKSDKNSPRKGTLYILPEEVLAYQLGKKWAKTGQNRDISIYNYV